MTQLPEEDKGIESIPDELHECLHSEWPEPPYAVVVGVHLGKMYPPGTKLEEGMSVAIREDARPIVWAGEWPDDVPVPMVIVPKEN